MEGTSQRPRTGYVAGDRYKIVMRALKQNFPRVDLDRERKVELAGMLFPEAEPVEWEAVGIEEQPLEDITPQEVAEAADNLKSNRALDPDGILPEALKEFIKLKGEVVTSLLNREFVRGSFPTPWKRARLLLTPKPGRDQSAAGGFRPICLLDTLGKLFEGIIRKRLDTKLEIKAPLDHMQFGFRKGRSTVGALQEVTRSVEEAGRESWNALILMDVINMANWSCIVEELRKRRIDGRLVGLVMN